MDAEVSPDPHPPGTLTGDGKEKGSIPLLSHLRVIPAYAGIQSFL